MNVFGWTSFLPGVMFFLLFPTSLIGVLRGQTNLPQVGDLLTYIDTCKCISVHMYVCHMYSHLSYNIA